MSESGPFEQADMASDGSYLTSPSAKRARFDDSANVDEVAQVTEVETVEEDAMPSEVDHTVTITVPSSQFEIEINSQNDSGSPTEIGTIQTGDLSGPAFGIVHETQEISLSEPQLSTEGGALTTEEGGTLNAIGRALIQMQQGGQSITAGSSPGIPQSQLILTRAASSDSDTVASSGGSNAPLYVMIPPASSAEILQAMGQSRPIAPKSTVVATADLSNTDVATSESLRKTREEQRKATHNEVERRRRDRINELIKVLAQVVPGCQKKDAATGNVVGYVYSKGTVLDKTVEYLKELLVQNEQLSATAKLAEKSANALSVLQNQIAVLEKENAFLRAQIIQFGIDAAASGSQGSAAGGNRQLLNSPLAQSLLNSVSQSPQVASAINNTVVGATPTNPALSSPGGAGAGPQQQSSTQLAAQQLLISLAQSLTNSPLLTSQAPPSGSSPSPLVQAVSTSPPTVHLTATAGTPSRLNPVTSSSSTPSTPQLTPPSQTQPIQPQSLLTTTPGTPSGSTSTPTPTLAAAISLPSSAPVLGSLVQTLASLAGTNTTASPSPVPKAAQNSVTLPPSLASANLAPAQLQTTGISPSSSSGATTGGLSAAAAASLLNTLILAQNVLTGGGASPAGVGVANSASGGGVVLGDSSSVLSGIGLETVATTQ